MSNNRAILVVTAIVNKVNMADLPTYLDQISPITEKHGAVPLAKYKSVENIAGKQSPDLISVMEFPSKEVILEMIQSKGFRDLGDLRASVFSNLNMMICE